jgi:hypothetical protein
MAYAQPGTVVTMVRPNETSGWVIFPHRHRIFLVKDDWVGLGVVLLGSGGSRLR